MQIAIFLLLTLFWGSSVVWWAILARLLRKQPMLEPALAPHARWRTIPEWTAVVIVLALFGIALQASLMDKRQDLKIDMLVLSLQVIIPLGMALLLIMLLPLSGSKLCDYGITLSNPEAQLRLGLRGFLAVILPTTVLLWATSFLRSRESEHALLKLLDESPSAQTIGAVILAAAIAAPLWEELQFRVILQGWLSTLIPSRAAIGLVAFAFAVVHGWRDGLALAPLALILGYVYDRQRSYLAVVVIHALFNATMLTLQLLMPNKS